MLSVEIILSEHGELRQQVEIYFDQEGLDYLLDRLTRIHQGKTDHYHMMTDSWGDGELSENKHSPASLLVHHLKLTKI